MPTDFKAMAERDLVIHLRRPAVCHAQKCRGGLAHAPSCDLNDAFAGVNRDTATACGSADPLLQGGACGAGVCHRQ